MNGTFHCFSFAEIRARKGAFHARGYATCVVFIVSPAKLSRGSNFAIVFAV